MHFTKHAARVAAALAALALVAPGAARAGIDDGLVASFTFDDGTPRDVSGTGNDGTPVGDVGYADGFRGAGLKLKGVVSPGYVSAGPSDSLAFLDDYTFALWFRIDGTYSMDGWGQLNDDGHHTLFSKAGDTSGLDIRTWRSQENGLLDILAFDGRCCGGGAALASDYVIDVGGWHHAAFTSGGGVVRLYLDGAPVGEMPTATFDLNPAMASMPLWLGIDTGAMWYPLDGMLDEVRVYRRALTEGEVAHLAARWTFGGFLPPLAADGSTVIRSGNNVSVKFQLTDPAGALVTTANATLTYAEVLDPAAGTLGPAAVPADGGSFRYDALVGQYVYNLSTRGLAIGKTYQLTVTVDDGSTHTARVALR